MGTVLVTGGGGFLGKYIARSLAEAGEQVVITYRRFFSGAPHILSDIMESKVKAARCDVLDPHEITRVIRNHGVDSIVHAANFAPYDGTIYQVLQNNLVGIINVMEAATLASIKKVTYISSSQAAVGLAGRTGAEDEMINIASPAAGTITPSKKCGETISLFYGATFGISVAIVRPGLMYGPYGESEVVVPKVLGNILEAVAKGKPINLPDLHIDDQFYLTYVRDMADLITLAHLAPKNKHLVYTITEEKPTSWREISDIIKEFVPGVKITFGRGGKPAGDQNAPKVLRGTSEFGFKSKYDMRKGLREEFDWYKAGQP